MRICNNAGCSINNPVLSPDMARPNGIQATKPSTPLLQSSMDYVSASLTSSYVWSILLANSALFTDDSSTSSALFPLSAREPPSIRFRQLDRRSRTSPRFHLLHLRVPLTHFQRAPVSLSSRVEALGNLTRYRIAISELITGKTSHSTSPTKSAASQVPNASSGIAASIGSTI